MATAVVMPKQGQSVESCIIVSWNKAEGDTISAGETLCEVETDKALLEVESTVSGTVLALFFQVGDEVDVLTNIAVVGEPGEAIDEFRPAGEQPETVPSPASSPEPAPVPETTPAIVPAVEANSQTAHVGISPRARNLAEREQVDLVGLTGTGPQGRIIERDVQALLDQRPLMTPLAKSMVEQGGYEMPSKGSGVSGRIVSDDLIAAEAASTATMTSIISQASDENDVEIIPVKGIRKVIATRMVESLQSTAQLTLNGTADARAIQAYRKRLKNSPADLELSGVTINDLILFTVSRILPQYPNLNAHFNGDTIAQYKNVHLGFAVDTPRGLMVPVIKQANHRSLKQISVEAKRLATACIEGKISPDDLSGGTFTISNLGSFGVEHFTPVLNPPQVAILGVGNINLKPIQVEDEVQFIPHLALSLTTDHQAIDGAPGARFLQALSQGLANFEMLLAI